MPFLLAFACMDDDGPAPFTRDALLHTLLRLAPLVAAGLVFPRLLDRFGVRDISWAPPECGWILGAAPPGGAPGAAEVPDVATSAGPNDAPHDVVRRPNER